jgi:hypothetical protein
MNTRMHVRKFYHKLVFFTSDKRYHKGFINNISLNGIFIETQDNFSNGQVLKIFIPGRKFGIGAIIHGEVARLTQKGIGLKLRKNKQGKIVIMSRGQCGIKKLNWFPIEKMIVSISNYMVTLMAVLLLN